MLNSQIQQYQDEVDRVNQILAEEEHEPNGSLMQSLVETSKHHHKKKHHHHHKKVKKVKDYEFYKKQAECLKKRLEKTYHKLNHLMNKEMQKGKTQQHKKVTSSKAAATTKK